MEEWMIGGHGGCKEYHGVQRITKDNGIIQEIVKTKRTPTTSIL